MKPKTYVAAYEVSEYIYCKRCWWKRFNGFVQVTEQMWLGMKAHDQIYDRMQNFDNTKSIIVFITLVIFFLFILLLLFKLMFFKNI